MSGRSNVQQQHKPWKQSVDDITNNETICSFVKIPIGNLRQGKQLKQIWIQWGSF